MDDRLERLIKQVLKFRDDRDWKQFHTPKDLAIDLSLEANEVLEHFLWKTDKDTKNYLRTHKQEVADELMDVLHVILLMSEELKIDVEDAFTQKMKHNAKKYPITKARGKNTKYNQL